MENFQGIKFQLCKNGANELLKIFTQSLSHDSLLQNSYIFNNTKWTRVNIAGGISK